MNGWQCYKESIKREVDVENVGWLVGGLLRRQLRLMVALVPLFAAAFLMDEGPAQTVVVWTSFTVWAAWNAITVGIGTFYISRWADRLHERRMKPRLSREYRKK